MASIWATSGGDTYDPERNANEQQDFGSLTSLAEDDLFDEPGELANDALNPDDIVGNPAVNSGARAFEARGAAGVGNGRAAGGRGAHPRRSRSSVEENDIGANDELDPLDQPAALETSLRTAGDAYRACSELFGEQLQRARGMNLQPNESIRGDSSARSAFLLLLTDAQQRNLFIQIASTPENWPRVRALFGAPPYHFLKPGDANMLSASGFARGRTNMVYDTMNRIANIQQFGPGQLEDEHTREYRIAPQTFDDSDPLPGAEYFQRAPAGLMLQVKVRKAAVDKKREMLKSRERKKLFFPQPGETITLRETRGLLLARGMRAGSSISLRVKGLWPRSQGASTAAVLVVP